MADTGVGVATAKTAQPAAGQEAPQKQQYTSDLDQEGSKESSDGDLAVTIGEIPPEPVTAVLEPCDEKDNGTNASGDSTAPAAGPGEGPLFSVFTRREKIFMTGAVAIIGIISPLTGSVYLPAMNDIAADLGVRTSLINLTITTYQIFQGLAPSLLASIADTWGRRPAYILTLSIYVVANLALALQDNYAALLVLRCLQSAGSAATIALASGVASDVVTRAERGGFVGWASVGISLGPALGPVFGGLLAGYQGWRAIFWFLLILGVVLLVIVVVAFPETCRAVVGNGSVRPRPWNMSVIQWLQVRKAGGRWMEEEDPKTIAKPRKNPNPLSALKILLEPEGGITLGFGALMFAGYFMVMTTLSEQLSSRFHLTTVQIGLCYIPLGFGSLLSRFTAGLLFDWNFKRHARLLNMPLDKSRQQSIEILPIERIRLEISIPMVYISCGTLLGYCWAMQSTSTSLAGIEVALFFQGLFFSGALQGFNTLILDTHQDTPSTATAANNLFRCLVSAGGTAVAPLMIERIGIGFMGVFISGVWFLLSPCLWLVLLRGASWREKQRLRREKKDAERAGISGSKV